MTRTQFRYSRISFEKSILAALGLTAIVSFLVWLFAQLFGARYYNAITGVSALIFFGFCSAAMIWRFVRNDVVLAVRPDGLFDSRYSNEPVPWETIKDIRLSRIENEFQLFVSLWPANQNAVGREFLIDLAPLDGTLEHVLEGLSMHKSISVPSG